MSTNNDLDLPDINEIKFNGMSYTFQIGFRNADGEFMLPKELFKELMVDEGFLDWGFRGYLVYDNANERLERYKENSKVKNSEFFHFRMDGTDEIIINLKPVLEGDSNRSKKAMQIIENEDGKKLNEFMSLSLRGAIYDTEDLNKATIENKAKKIYFWDYYQNKAKSLNQRVSCGEYLTLPSSEDSKSDIPTLNNSDREVLNGKLLKYICEEKLGATVSKEKWENGAISLFYTSNPESTVYNDMEYLSTRWIDTEGYPGYFKFDRFDNEFQLRSYKTIFHNYNKSLREIVHFTDSTNPIGNGLAPPRISKENVFMIPKIGDISAYKYVKMSSADNIKEINTRLSYGYDDLEGTFHGIISKSHIQYIKNLHKNLLKDFASGNTNPLMVINDDKLKNKNTIEELGGCTEIVPTKKGIEAALLLNDSIYIELLGIPSRQPGTFIEITSDSDTQGIWEDRFLGTWFIVDVRHKIIGPDYLNRILAVKPNMSQEFEYSLDVINK